MKYLKIGSEKFDVGSLIFDVGNVIKSHVSLPLLTSHFKLHTSSGSKNGFTLVELLIYMGILAVMIYVLADVLSTILTAQTSTQSNAQVAQDGRYIYSRLTYDINRAQSVSLPSNLGDSSDNLNLVINATNYSFAVATPSGNLEVTDGTGTYTLNGPDTEISNLRFVRIGNVSGKHTFQINFTIKSKIPINGRIDSEEFETVAGLR
jgi:type II secretory pathway pseudopilin PulG